MDSNEEIPLPQAARRLGLSWAQAWRLVMKGDLEAYQKDGRWYVSMAKSMRKKDDPIEERQNRSNRGAAI